MRSTYCPNPKYSEIPRSPYCLIAPLLLLLAVLVLVPATSLRAQFNKYEIKVITEDIEERFDLLMDTWKEELYFEMYDFGQRQSQMRLTRAEFAQRMVELKWRPSLTPIEIDRIEILYLNYAVIYFWQEFENKINVLRTIRKYMVFPVILENGVWKFDLTQLIRIPFEGKFEKPKEPDPQESLPTQPRTETPQPQAEAEGAETEAPEEPEANP